MNIRSILVFLAATLVAASSSAADIHVLCSNGIRAVIEELRPRFEQQSGDKVLLTYEPSTQLKKRIDAGEAFDLTILTTTLIDEEITAGHLAADSRTMLARSGLGVSIRAGAKKPNVSTVNAFKNALLNAESITYDTLGARACTLEVVVASLLLTSHLKT
jgi:molybdate transport system substrate-binding protein